MTITNDYQVFLNGCIKNNAVDYKVLYENKCKENETVVNDAKTLIQKLQEQVKEYSESWQSLLEVNHEKTKTIKFLKNELKDNEIDLQKFDELVKFKEDAEENCSSYAVIEKLNQEFKTLEEEYETFKSRNEEIGNRAQNFYNIIQTLIISLVNMNSEYCPGDDISIGDNWNYQVTEEERNGIEEILDDMNRDDWNGDDNHAQLRINLENEIVFEYNDSEEEDE